MGPTADRVRHLIKPVEEALHAAELHGAFVPALQATFEMSPFYVERTSLLDVVVQTLKEQADNPGTKGVLITGLRGMGKTTLAQAALMYFSKDRSPGEAFAN